jgi:hypothetical protein
MVVGIFYLVLINVQPFTGIINFGEEMKSGWSSDSSEPPVPHAEEMTLGELAKTINVDPDLLVSHLKKQGISADINSLIKEIAQNYNISPQEIFEKLQVQGNSKTDHPGAKRGYGRMTLLQICNEKNISLGDAIMKLDNHGINAQGESMLRDLAQKSNKSPIEIVKIIEDLGKN